MLVSIIYSNKHLKWIKKVPQSCPKTRKQDFTITLTKGFDPLQMLTSVYYNHYNYYIIIKSNNSYAYVSAYT